MDLVRADAILSLLEQEAQKVQGLGELRELLQQELATVQVERERVTAICSLLDDAIARSAQIGERADEIATSLRGGLNSLHEELKTAVRELDGAVAGRLDRSENQLQAELRREIGAGLDRVRVASHSEFESLREQQAASFLELADRAQRLLRLQVGALTLSVFSLAAIAWLAWLTAVVTGVLPRGFPG